MGSAFASEGRGAEAVARIQLRGTKMEVPVGRVLFEGREWVHSEADDAMAGVLVVTPGRLGAGPKAAYITNRGRGALMVQLMLMGKEMPQLRRVFPPPPADLAAVGVWEIDYPEGVTFPEDYGLTDFPDRDLKMACMYGRR